MRQGSERRLVEAPAAPAPVADIAGYRVLRRLAHGRSAAVYLGHAAGGAPASTLALRVFHAGAEPERVDREIAVRSTLPAGIAAALHDVVTLPDGRICLVLDRDDGPTLAELLAGRGAIRAGEAVTILAPLAVALDRLHRHGWSHGALRPAAVRFDPAGRAHLAGFSGAEPLPTGAERTRALRADYEGLAGIARAVCAAVDEGSAAPHDVQELLDWLAGRVAAHPFLPCAAELERRLFALGRPLAVRMAATADAALDQAMPTRLSGQAGTGRAGGAGGFTGADASMNASMIASADEPDRVPATPWLRWVEPVRGQLQARLHAHRRPLVVAAALAGALFVLAITLLPPGGARSAAVAPVTVTVPASPPASAPAASAAPADATPEVDPVEAAARLLAARERCFRESSLLCLDGVLDSDGPLAAADAALIRRAQLDGTALLPEAFDPGSIGLVEQSGGAALLALAGTGDNAKPASLLMIRGEAGWLLRELFDY